MSAAVEPPRLLVIAAGVWFVGALALALGARLPDSTAMASLFPSVRLCLIACAAGVLVGWPLLRLSLPSPARPVATMVMDLTTILFLFQAVLWPMRLATPWSIERTLLIDLVVGSSGVAVGGLVALGSARASSWWRALAMAACLALASGLFVQFGLPGGVPELLASMDSRASMPIEGEWASCFTQVLAAAAVIVGASLASVVLGSGVAQRRATLARDRAVG
ncbi:MAG: hypothetical protein EXS03_01855 [Phycisphaerales bacterium]|nr:hypothetical protein [Phycisphaerales bacterium]